MRSHVRTDRRSPMHGDGAPFCGRRSKVRILRKSDDCSALMSLCVLFDRLCGSGGRHNEAAVPVSVTACARTPRLTYALAVSADSVDFQLRNHCCCLKAQECTAQGPASTHWSSLGDSGTVFKKLVWRGFSDACVKQGKLQHGHDNSGWGEDFCLRVCPIANGTSLLTSCWMSWLQQLGDTVIRLLNFSPPRSLAALCRWAQ